VARLIGENAGEMGCISAPNNAKGRFQHMPAALLCRTFYFDEWTGLPVDNGCRSAAIGTLNAL
jgi:hypothetical protein